MHLHPSEPPTSGVLRNWLEGERKSNHVADLHEALNSLIDDPDIKIGPSYFMRPEVHRDDAGLERMWRTAILPLLEEHHYPAWQPTRLNARYQPALRLGELVLRGGSLDQEQGRLVVDGFVLDMPLVFEQFLTVALREALTPRGGRVLGQPRYHFDEERRIELKPDIVWQHPDGTPRAVVDAKYKAEKPSGYPNADAYQMLAYCTRLGLPVGHLVYAKGAGVPGRHRVLGSDVTILRHALDLDTTADALLGQVRTLGQSLPGQRRECRPARVVA